jgi:hypothetical protein
MLTVSHAAQRVCACGDRAAAAVSALQGAVIGGGYASFSTQLKRAVLGVPGGCAVLPRVAVPS